MNKYSNLLTDYVNSSISIVNELPDIYKKFYDTHFSTIRDTEMYDVAVDLLAKLKTDNMDFPISLENLVLYALVTNDAKTTKESYQKCQKYIYNRKGYLLRKFTLEVNDKDPNGILARYVSACMEQERLIQYSGIEHFEDLESGCNKVLAEIKEWSSNSSEPLINYKFFKTLTPRNKVLFYIGDLSIFAYTFIRDNWYSNISGYLTKTPHFLLQDPIFSLHAGQADVKYEKILAEDGRTKVIAYEQHDENTSIIMGEYYITENEQIINLLNSDSYKKLSLMDNIVFSYIYSSITVHSFTAGSVVFRLRECYYGTSSTKRVHKKQYISLIESLYRLYNYAPKTAEIDENGGATFRLRRLIDELEFYVPEKNMTILTECEENNEQWFENLSDLGNIEVKVVLSRSTKEIWQSDTTTKIFTKEFQKLESRKARSIMFYLQERRISVYPVLNDFISYTMLEGQIHSDGVKRSRFVKEIADCLDLLIEKKVLLTSYEKNNLGFDITYADLTDYEKKILKIDTSSDNSVSTNLYISTDGQLGFEL